MIKLSKKDIGYIIKTAKRAGSAIMSHYQKEEDNIEHKADNSPVSQADLASQDIIIEELKKRFPEIPIVSEENDETLNAKILKKAKVFWLIDPLDGTWSFIKRRGCFVINVALIYEGNPIWGLIYSPQSEDCYYLDENNICHLLNNGGLSLILPKESFNGGLDFLVSQQDIDQRTQDFIDKYQVKTITPIPSAIKFGLMVKGRGDIYPRFKRTCLWDTAAGHALLNACGGEIYDFNLKPLRYDSSSIYNPDFVAVVKTELIEQLKK